jgi:hypothetical protein
LARRADAYPCKSSLVPKMSRDKGM